MASELAMAKKVYAILPPRVPIGYIVPSALEIAQNRIKQDPALDDALSERYSLEQGKVDVNGHNIATYLTLRFDEKLVGPMGETTVLKYAVDAVPASLVASTLNEGKGLPMEVPDARPESIIVSIFQVTSADLSMHDYANAEAQGVMLSTVAKRASSVTILTNGVKWVFLSVVPNTAAVASPFTSTIHFRSSELHVDSDLPTILRLLVNAVSGTYHSSMKLMCMNTNFVPAGGICGHGLIISGCTL
ncbi:hypothetical protein C8F01DRAFT_1120801 [Mycena amicta]|nr:hypothetical protein C8F01DRAFT_1120801 [Mycena amicta]